MTCANHFSDGKLLPTKLAKKPQEHVQANSENQTWLNEKKNHSTLMNLDFGIPGACELCQRQKIHQTQLSSLFSEWEGKGETPLPSCPRMLWLIWYLEPLLVTNIQYTICHLYFPIDFQLLNSWPQYCIWLRIEFSSYFFLFSLEIISNCLTMNSVELQSLYIQVFWSWNRYYHFYDFLTVYSGKYIFMIFLCSGKFY